MKALITVFAASIGSDRRTALIRRSW